MVIPIYKCSDCSHVSNIYSWSLFTCNIPCTLKDIDCLEREMRYFTHCFPGLISLGYFDRLRELKLGVHT